MTRLIFRPGVLSLELKFLPTRPGESPRVGYLLGAR